MSLLFSVICLNNFSLILTAEGHDAGDEANKTEVQELASKPMPFFAKFWELQVCHSPQKDFCNQNSVIPVSLTICLLPHRTSFFKLADLKWLHALHALHVCHACTHFAYCTCFTHCTCLTHYTRLTHSRATPTACSSVEFLSSTSDE